jgi:16S rRNA G966 N2-methylase RsmD
MNTRPDFTFKHNIKKGRHGWLRLTPAYSIKVVEQILDEHPEIKYVLDPFAGTGTTGLVCGERGLKSDLIDINPFLVWFNRTKTSNYSFAQIVEAKKSLYTVVDKVRDNTQSSLWIPPISNIDRWWGKDKLKLLACFYEAINNSLFEYSSTKDLLLVAFCRIIVEWSNAAFNHQSMSFKKAQNTLFDYQEEFLIAEFINTANTIVDTATQEIKGHINIIHADSRHVPKPEDSQYDCVITSPPYPNRMSYIRELRPYMYWLEYLKEAREAGELDWQAIGGTWGIATSLLGKWQPNGTFINYPGFAEMISAIANQSIVLANYVHKYFIDIALHINSLFPHIASGGKVFYIVGNSKFYETLVPAQELYASILDNVGFINTKITILRKRNSKKELYEFIISAEKA